MPINGPYDPERLVRAQDLSATFGRAVEELRHGQRTSHWMWFVFPQIAGLGQSPMSRRNAISSYTPSEPSSSNTAFGYK
ncbi:MAG TPA: DUF1810 family protein [Acidimicrobiales bacterium]|nr:DUF1810 family protein [Acidimicrobiales bacterium]